MVGRKEGRTIRRIGKKAVRQYGRTIQEGR